MSIFKNTARIMIAGLFLVAGVSPSAQAKDYGARINELDYRITVNGNTARVLRHTRISIDNPKGEEFSFLSVPESKFEKIKSVEIRVFDANNKLLYKRNHGDMSKQCGFGADYTLYADDCLFYFRALSQKYPYSIEFDYELDILSLFFLPSPSLQWPIPTEQATIELRSAEDKPIDYKLYGFDQSPLEEIKSGKRILTWAFSNLPAKADLSHLPPEAQDKARLSLLAPTFELEKYSFEGRSWKNIGLWYKHLADSRYLKSNTPIPASSNKQEMIEKAWAEFSRITATCRYVSVSIGIGGWQPHSAASVESKGYGDCKDLSTLLVSRLRNIGIAAYPALVLTTGNGAVDAEFPDFNFNHAIAVAIVDGDTLWMDPTCDQCAPGELRRDVQGIHILLVTDTGGVLVTTPTDRPEKNQIVRTSHFEVSQAGDLTAGVTAVLTGINAQDLRSFFQNLPNGDEGRLLVAEWLLGDEKRFTLDSFSVKNLDEKSKPFVLKAEVSSKRPIQRIKQTLYFSPFIFMNRDAYDNLHLEERPVDLYDDPPTHFTDTVIITGALLMDSYSIVIPNLDSANSANAQASVSFVREPDRVVAIMQQVRHVRRIPSADFVSFGQYILKRKALLDKPIKFEVN
ncbi:MAG: transglutaminase family protein [candidate division Zixibacteria bacterium]|nr:transglutaminase family protein [candidate division Zixibacteria bacterium]